MKWFGPLLKLITVLVSALFTMISAAICFLIDFIDGDDEADDVYDDDAPHYNFRTGDMDPVKRADGIYNEPL